LFVFGLALLVVEFFLFPGHFVSAALGTIAVLAALVLAMTGRLPSEPIVPSWGQVQIPLAKVFGAMVGAMIGAALLARWLPKSTLFKKMELSAATSAAEGYTTSGRRPGAARLDGRRRNESAPLGQRTVRRSIGRCGDRRRFDRTGQIDHGCRSAGQSGGGET
jgi:membrane-bound serine protease (ClpP class)